MHLVPTLSQMKSLEKVMASGAYPPVKALPKMFMSLCTPCCAVCVECQDPSFPQPEDISSVMRITLYSLHNLRMLIQAKFDRYRTPACTITGSIMKEPTSPDLNSRSNLNNIFFSSSTPIPSIGLSNLVRDILPKGTFISPMDLERYVFPW